MYMRTGSSRGDTYRQINPLYRNLEAKGFLQNCCKDTGCTAAEEVELVQYTSMSYPRD